MQRKAEKSRREFTVRRLTADYVEEISERKRTCAEDQRIFKVYVLPVIGDLSVAEVDRKAVSKVLKYLNGKRTTNQATMNCKIWIQFLYNVDTGCAMPSTYKPSYKPNRQRR